MRIMFKKKADVPFEKCTNNSGTMAKTKHRAIRCVSCGGSDEEFFKDLNFGVANEKFAHSCFNLLSSEYHAS